MWKSIPNSRYEVTETGKVRHIKHKRILKHFKGAHSYPAIQFNKQLKLVHRLILEAFRGPCPKGMESRHLDGNPSNCHLDNLEWATHKENMQDCGKHGTKIFGTKQHLAKLNEEKVKEIRKLYVPYSRKWNQKTLAKRFNMAYQTIGFIVRNQTWKHVV